MHLSKQAAQPRSKSNKKKYPYLYFPSQISNCPECGGLKAPTSIRCADCRAQRPPVVDTVFIVEGERCRKIPLTQGKYTVVDEGLYNWLMKWRWYARWDPKGKRFYVGVKVKNERNKYVEVQMHGIIVGLKKGQMGDHVNKNSLDNRLSNLRPCSPPHNQANTKIRSDNTTGYRGIKRRPSGTWAASIQVNKKAIYIGQFSTPEQAAHAYDAAAIRYCGEFATLNFP